MHNSNEWRGPARSETVRAMRQAIGEHAHRHGFADAALDDIRSCVSEAVTNAVVHGYRDGRPRGTVTVTVELSRDALIVVVSDDGIGFAPRTDSPGLGLGLPTIAVLAVSMSISTPAGGGTEMRMAFARDLAPTRAPQAQA